MITRDYKNGYHYDTRKSKGCATYNRKYTVKQFLIDTLAGIASAVLILAPIVVYLYL